MAPKQILSIVITRDLYDLGIEGWSIFLSAQIPSVIQTGNSFSQNVPSS